jgi:hypothetical protein
MARDDHPPFGEGRRESGIRGKTPVFRFTRAVLASFAVKVPSRAAAKPPFSRKYVSRALRRPSFGPNCPYFRRVKLPQRA